MDSDREQRRAIWVAAIGLQDVDGLTVSPHLLETAKRNIEGVTSIGATYDIVRSYYAEKERANAPAKEADIVSAAIARILSEDAFTFSVPGFLAVHKRIFDGVFDHAGYIRPYNVTRPEWVLGGKSVVYAPFGEIQETLEYDIRKEKERASSATRDRMIRDFARFVSGIWQIHPFCEGNTRMVAVFFAKYLGSLGLGIDYTCFSENSLYFRNALVRANYNDFLLGICEDHSFLEMFLENVIFGARHELRNREMRVGTENSVPELRVDP